jgi:hypothetical protein
MKKMIALQDLKEMDEKQVIEHLVNEYSGTASGHDYGSVTEETKSAARLLLHDKQVLIAYESTGDYGCDSSGFFLLQDIKTKDLFEIHGSHCSCYGFEGQLSLEPTTIASLKDRAAKQYVFSTGGYDNSERENINAVIDFITSRL